MPAPDIHYFLDCSVECGHMAVDTHRYLSAVAQDTDAVVDGYDRSNPERFERHMDCLADMGLYCENSYLGWRKHNREEARAVSLVANRDMKQTIANLADNLAREVISSGQTHMGKGFEQSLVAAKIDRYVPIQARAARRIRGDLEGMNTQEMRVILLDMEKRRLAYVENMRQMMAGYRETDKANDYIERQQDLEKRKVIKRSLKFLRKLIGDDQTRLFVSGDRLRVEGEHCVYEIKRSGTIHQGHGGAKMSVFTKHDDIHLCDLCIYTPETPVLDHVASIVMHLRAGEEKEILSIGNPYNIQSLAHKQEWLIPFLPKPTQTIVLDDIFGTSIKSKLLRENSRMIVPMKRRIIRDLCDWIKPFSFPLLGSNT